jgi:hypothetical protein
MCLVTETYRSCVAGCARPQTGVEASLTSCDCWLPGNSAVSASQIASPKLLKCRDLGRHGRKEQGAQPGGDGETCS